MLTIVKLALRITTDAFDMELNMLINDCIDEMTSLGVVIEFLGERYILDRQLDYLSTIFGQRLYVGEDIDESELPEIPTSPQIMMAIIAYCKWLFGNNPDADKWRDIYQRKLAQLKTTTGFTNWNATEV